jgi:hypothetical protein
LSQQQSFCRHDQRSRPPKPQPRQPDGRQQSLVGQQWLDEQCVLWQLGLLVVWQAPLWQWVV